MIGNSNFSDTGVSVSKIKVGIILVLTVSLLGGLIPAVLALRAKRNGFVVFWWFLFSLLITGYFMHLSTSLVTDNSPEGDEIEILKYYFGLITLVFNGISSLFLLLVIFIRKQ
jgi:uncharacterized membrane protein